MKEMIELFKGFRQREKRMFLAAYSQCGRISKASEMVGIDRTCHYYWLRCDEEYAEAFEQAREIAADTFEDEVCRRAFEGVEKPLSFQGRLTGDHVTEYSDILAMFQLKKLRPSYRDNAQVNVNVAGPAQINISLPELPRVEQGVTSGATKELEPYDPELVR